MATKPITTEDVASFIASAALNQTSITLDFAKMSLAETRVHRPKSGKTLLDLPLEFREKIYTFSMSSMPTRVYIDPEVRLRPSTFLPDVLPGICHVNETLGREAKIAWIRRTSFNPPDFESARALYDLSRWLSQFPDDTGFLAVRMLMLKARNLKSAYLESEIIVQPCTGLRFLTITPSPLALTEIIKRPNNQYYYKVLKSVETLANGLGMNAIFKAPALKTLRIYCEFTEIRGVLIDDREQTLHREEIVVNLWQMLERGLAENGRKVNFIFDFGE